MTDRQDDRYEVSARIQGRGGRGGRLLAALAALVVVAWGGVTLSDRLAGRPASSPRLETAPAVGAAVLEPPPPVIQRLRPGVDPGHVPVVLGGLGWLDPVAGTLSRGPTQDVWQWPFAVSDGTACICLETSAVVSAELHAIRYDATGSLISATTVEDWQPAQQVHGLVDAVLSPDGAAAIVASAVVSDAGAWTLRIQRISLDSQAASAVQDEADLGVDLLSIADPAQLQLRLAGAPDGSRYRISVHEIADDLASVAGSERSWTVRLAGGVFGALMPTPDEASSATPATCPDQAWATPATFVELCRSTVDAQGEQTLFVRIHSSDGQPAAVLDLDLGPVGPQDVVGWLVDGSHGIVYGWAAAGHVLYRVDVVTGDVRRLAFDPGNRLLLPEVVEASPGNAPPDSSSTLWQPTAPAWQPTDNPLVGSPDGRFLYATGLTGPGGDSTGVWVFDAQSLALVAHWPSLAAYRSLGLTNDGRYLVAIGGEGAAEIDTFGQHGSELAIHDAVDGSAVVILRQLEKQFGGTPALLPAGPPAIASGAG